METWGSLPKNQEDAATIDEEIDAKVQDHLDDADAHVEAGQSLQSHKASDIIDHLAESVLNDKLQPASRAFVAIVDVNGNGDFTDIQEAIEYAYSKGGGIVRLLSGIYNIAQNLQVRRNVDVLGSGKNETILDFGGNENFVNAIYPFVFGETDYISCDVINGSPVVTFSSGVKIITNINIQPGFKFFVDGNETEFTVLSVDSETQITLTENYDSTTGTYDCIFELETTFVNGSPVVTFPNGIDLTQLNFQTSYVLTNEYDWGVNHGVLSVDSETQLTMTENFVGVGGTYYIRIGESVDFLSNFESFSVRNCAADFVFDTDYYGYSPNIKDILFEDCGGILRSTMVYIAKPNIDDIYTINCVGPVYFNGSIGNVKNSRITSVAAAVKIFDTCDLGFVENVRVTLNSDYNNVIFYERFSFLAMTNCSFLYSRKFVDFSGGGPYKLSGISLVGNLIFMQIGYHCDLYIERTSFVANYVYLSTGYSLRIMDDSDENAVVGNVVSRNILDYGSNNVIEGNDEIGQPDIPGWDQAGEVWTYASATSFTIAGDKTGKYQKGDKVRLTNDSAVKYFYIISASYSSPNTTITITGETNLANSAITLSYYSKEDNPQGFKKGEIFFRARVKANSSQTLTNGALTLMNLDTESYDPNGNFDNSAGNYKYTAPISGYYQINAIGRVDFGGINVSTISFCTIQANGAEVGRGTRLDIMATGIGLVYSQAAVVAYLAKGDYVQLKMYQSSGANRTSESASEMSVQFLGV